MTQPISLSFGRLISELLSIKAEKKEMEWEFNMDSLISSGLLKADVLVHVLLNHFFRGGEDGSLIIFITAVGDGVQIHYVISGHSLIILTKAYY